MPSTRISYFKTSALTGTALALLAGAAHAQVAAPSASVSVTAPAPTAAASVSAPAAPAVPAAPAAPSVAAPSVDATATAPAAPAPAVVAEPPAMPVAPAPVAPAPVAPAPMPPVEPMPLAPLVDPAEPVAEEAAAESPLNLFMFADANYGITSSHRDAASPFHRAYAFNDSDGTTSNGFALEWMGVDASYTIGEVSATASFRFGDAVNTFFGGDKGGAGIDNLLQGYLTWAPTENISLDLGQFGTIYGAEVAESWVNLNYTRGGLYYAMQPFWHTGLRASFQLDPKFALKAMVVNGVNSSFDEDDAPSVGLQAALTPSDEFALYLGGFQTLDPEHDSSGFDTFLDLVATLNIDAFSAVLNADFNQNAGDDASDSGDDSSFYGVSLALGYNFTNHFGLAGRYEFLGDPDGAIWENEDGNVQTFTLTFDVKPLDTDNLIVRWDNRFEKGSDDIFADQENKATDKFFGSVVGVVVKMD